MFPLTHVMSRDTLIGVKKTTTSKRLRRSATAYKRLYYKTGQEHYWKLAQRLERQAEREENRS